MAVGMWEAAVVIARAVTYAATLAASGGVFFLAYSHALLDGGCAARIRRLLRVLLLIAALAGGAMILATAASMSGDAGGLADTGLMRLILQAGEGKATLARLSGLTLMAWGLTAYRAPAPMAMLGSVAAATSFAWTGHVHSLGAARGGISLPWLAIVVHLLGVAFWLGALIPLLMATAAAEMPRIAAVVGRFGTAALSVVGALLAAGAVLLCLLLRGVSDLWEDDYGRLFLTKIVLVCCLLALAALNHLRLTPRLFAQDASALKVLKRSIMAELAVAGCILTVTAAITTLTGAPALELSK